MPAGQLKLSCMLTVNKGELLMADLAKAVRDGKPITDWTPYGPQSRIESVETLSRTTDEV